MHTLKTLLTLTMLLLVGICFCSLPATFADEANSEKKDKQVARLATAIEDLQLSKKERKQALKLIDTYGADRAKIASEGWDRWIAEIDLIGQLQLDLETVLPEEQLVQWVNTIFKTDKDNWQYVKDERIQHRTYKFAEAGGVEIPYALFVPTTYDETKAYPIMVGLHGMECAHDTAMAFDPLLDLAEEQGYIVVTPLGYRWNSWYGSVDPGRSGRLAEQDVMRVLDIARSEFNIDKDRIYLFGHSMGGAGTYHLAGQYPDVWAGLAVINPGPFAKPDTLELCKHLPILVLQGDQDNLATTTRTWVAKMRKLGMQHIYLEVPGVGHEDFGMARIVSFFNTVQKFSRIKALIIDGQNNHAGHN
jgi:predicted peptidase